MENNQFDKIAYNNAFNSKSYDRITILVPKGKKEVIKEYADNTGESVNGYIKKAIIARIKADTGEDIDL